MAWTVLLLRVLFFGSTPRSPEVAGAFNVNYAQSVNEHVNVGSMSFNAVRERFSHVPSYKYNVGQVNPTRVGINIIDSSNSRSAMRRPAGGTSPLSRVRSRSVDIGSANANTIYHNIYNNNEETSPRGRADNKTPPEPVRWGGRAPEPDQGGARVV